jgi:hypothetical protein
MQMIVMATVLEEATTTPSAPTQQFETFEALI